MIRNIVATFSDTLYLAYLVLFDTVLFSFRYSGYSSLLLWQFFRRRRSRMQSTIATGIRSCLYAYSEHPHRARAYFLLGEETSSDYD